MSLPMTPFEFCGGYTILNLECDCSHCGMHTILTLLWYILSEYTDILGIGIDIGKHVHDTMLAGFRIERLARPIIVVSLHVSYTLPFIFVIRISNSSDQLGVTSAAVCSIVTGPLSCRVSAHAQRETVFSEEIDGAGSGDGIIPTYPSTKYPSIYINQ